jgi:hypothetical protein
VRVGDWTISQDFTFSGVDSPGRYCLRVVKILDETNGGGGDEGGAGALPFSFAFCNPDSRL